MTDATDQSRKEKTIYVMAFCLLATFYAMTRPLNHSESYDSLNYVLFAENFSFGTAPDSRNILFHAVNRIIVVAAKTAGLQIGTLELLVAISVLTGALSLVLFARLLQKHYEVSAFSACSGAAFLGLTYGYWRYTGAVEVYMPSIFLILCSLSLIFQFLQRENSSSTSAITAGAISGLAVLFYQPNIIILFIAAFVLFCSKSRLRLFAVYSFVGATVYLAGLVWSFVAVTGQTPTPAELVSFVTSRNGEFRQGTPIKTAIVKLILAFGHDLFSAHWTQAIEPVREVLKSRIPGCVYNFQVVAHAGKGIQSLVAIAAIAFLPMLALFARLHWVAIRQWNKSRLRRPTLFLLAWLGIMGAIVAKIDPGSFEAWIPMLVPFAGLICVCVIEPCYRQGKKKAIIGLLILMLAYNFFGGMAIWRNTSGDQFLKQSEWIRSELTEQDTVLLSEFDYRLVDYLQYYSSARIVHLSGEHEVTVSRSHPDIDNIETDKLLAQARSGEFRLFVLDDIISPTEDIKQCRSGEEKFAAAKAIGSRLADKANLVAENEFGKVYKIRFDDHDN